MLNATDNKVHVRTLARSLGMLVLLATIMLLVPPTAVATPAPVGNASVRSILSGTGLTQWASAIILTFTDPGDSDGDGIDDDLDQDDDNDGIDDSLDDGDMDDDGITDDIDTDDDGDGIDDDIDPDDDNDGIPDTDDDGDVDDDGITDQADDDDLYEDAQLNGDSLTIATRMGEPGLPTATAIVDVSGVPTFALLGGMGLFDSTGSSVLTLDIPLLPELSGLVVSLDSFGVNPFGAIIRSHAGNASFIMP